MCHRIRSGNPFIFMNFSPLRKHSSLEITAYCDKYPAESWPIWLRNFRIFGVFLSPPVVTQASYNKSDLIRSESPKLLFRKRTSICCCNLDDKTLKIKETRANFTRAAKDVPQPKDLGLFPPTINPSGVLLSTVLLLYNNFNPAKL